MRSGRSPQGTVTVRLLVSAFERSVLDKESGCVWGAVRGTDRAW